MKTFDQLLSQRRSIRKFDAEQGVNENEIRQMIAAAIEAPTWKNSQTGRYYVALSTEAKAKVMQCMPEFNQNSCKGAAALMVCTFKHNRSGFERNGEPTNELGNGWGCYDLGLQNALLLLKATELGIDTLVLGIRDADRLRAEMDIPEDETIVSIIAIGHRTEDAPRPKRKEPEDIMRIM